MHSDPRIVVPGPGLAALVLALWCLAVPSRAALGAPYVSVEADQAHLSAKLQSSRAASHMVHRLTMANGGVLQEFTRADGMVFAVTWRGPARPDLRQLLGGYFDIAQSDNAPRFGRRLRRPPSVNRPDFVMRAGGHSGAFWGAAWLPQMVPAGFATTDLD